MSVYQKVTEDFYNGIAAGDIEVVEALIDDDFELIVPMSSISMFRNWTESRRCK